MHRCLRDILVFNHKFYVWDQNSINSLEVDTGPGTWPDTTQGTTQSTTQITWLLGGSVQ